MKDATQLSPLCYTIHKLDKWEYIELYYFTLEGCPEATKIDCTIAQDAFTFTKAEDTLLLKPMASHKPSNKAIPDKNLTWCQMSIAKTTLLHHMSQTGWPEHYVVALAKFYLNLESHATCLQTDGNTILLHYQAQVWCKWHKALRSTSDVHLLCAHSKTLHHAPCALHHAPCTMRHAPCSPHHVPMHTITMPHTTCATCTYAPLPCCHVSFM